MAGIDFSFKDVNDLKPYKGNARTHSTKQIGEIVRSIEQTCFANPILIDETGEIIAGHGRLLAAKRLGLERAPTVTLTGLSEAQKRALRLADNKIASKSGWDADLLRIELDAIESMKIDLTITGFEQGEIDKLRIVRPVGDGDEIPSTPVKPAVRTGDVWLAGPHRVACGDVRAAALLHRLMEGAQADAAFLDCPYNVRISGHAGGRGKIKHHEFAFASGEMSEAEFETFLRDTLSAGASVSRSGAIHFVCMDHHHVDELTRAGGAVYDKRLNIAVWVKSNAGMGTFYRSQHELIFVYRVGAEPHVNNVQLGKHGRNRTNVWDAPSVNTFSKSRSADLQLHSTVKPTGLVADAILDVTRAGDLVLDTFLGSGTTLIAAERTGRRCCGMDIDAGYVEVALRRWSAMTGLEPRLEGCGSTLDEAALRGGDDMERAPGASPSDDQARDEPGAAGGDHG